MAERRNWTRTETLLAFRLYCYTPFGKLHTGNTDIIQLAERLGRTPSAVGMKACNFASLDPLHQARGVKGLSNRSKVEEQIWEEFQHDSEAIADEAEQAHESFVLDHAAAQVPEPTAADGPTEVERIVRTRRVQRFFRNTVLTSYDQRCALTGLSVPEFLNASHIIPWAVSHEHRADPSNGICLNALHDRAFDRGLISFDDRFQTLVSPRLSQNQKLGRLRSMLKEIEGCPLEIPERFAPSMEAMQYHRENIYQKE